MLSMNLQIDMNGQQKHVLSMGHPVAMGISHITVLGGGHATLQQYQIPCIRAGIN